MKKADKIRVLAVDDHAVIAESYRTLFTHLFENNFDFIKAQDCHEALTMLQDNNNNPFDMAIVDYSIPADAEQGLYNGGDVARRVREIMPYCRIIIMTMHKEARVLEQLYLKSNPEAIINKNDLTADELAEAFTAVLNGKRFYSPTVARFFERRDKGIVLEELDIMILLLLAKGIDNSKMERYIYLSGATIENRKSKIKELLEVKGNDDELVTEARNKGLI